MNTLDFSPSSLTKTGVYTDLNGLQSIKNQDQDVALKEVAQQFESMFVNMMLKSMRSANAVFEEGNFLHSQESKFFRDMHDQQMALTLSQGKGVGIADVLYRQLSRSYADEKPTDSIMETPQAYSNFQHRVKSFAEKPALPAMDKTEKIPDRVAMAESPGDFIQKVTPYAKAAAEKIGVDPSVLVAQSALETGWGQHVLADSKGKSSNNLFNIKADQQWTGEVVNTKSLEYRNGTFKPESSNFKNYDSLSESFSDYAKLILTKERYQKAVESSESPEQYLKEIKDAGYATDPQYVEKILRIYKQINHQQMNDIAENTLTAGDRS